jgi:hypothetical protein
VWTCVTGSFAQKANRLLHTRTNGSEEAGLFLMRTCQKRGVLRIT